jgi:hypothetical protein
MCILSLMATRQHVRKSEQNSPVSQCGLSLDLLLQIHRNMPWASQQEVHYVMSMGTRNVFGGSPPI